MNLSDVISRVFSLISERQYNSLNYFFNIQGADNSFEMDIANLKSKIELNMDLIILFENEIPLEPNFQLIHAIKNELVSMDITSLSNQDITVFDSIVYNKKFLDALEVTVNLAFTELSFFNENSKYDFITKLILWTNTYIKRIRVDDMTLNPKCFYVGEISQQEQFFLLLLFLLEFDIVYINPKQINSLNKLSYISNRIEVIEGNYLELKPFKEYKPLQFNRVETSTKRIKREVHKEIFDSDIEKETVIKPIIIEASDIDICTLINEETRMRPGFKRLDNTVYNPTFFSFIGGIHKNSGEYYELVNKGVDAENAKLFINNIVVKKNDDFVFRLVFYLLNDNTFDIDKILNDNTFILNKYGKDFTKFIIKRMNAFIRNMDDEFNFEINTNLILTFSYIIFSLDQEMIKNIRLIERSSDIIKNPKIILFLEKLNTIENITLLVLRFFFELGFDILIFDPSDNFENTKIMKTNLNYIRLESISYDAVYKRDYKVTRKSLLSKLFLD